VAFAAARLRQAELLGEPWCLPSLDVFPWSLICGCLSFSRIGATGKGYNSYGALCSAAKYLACDDRTLPLGILPRTVLHYLRQKAIQTQDIVRRSLPIQSYPVGIVTLKNRTFKTPWRKSFIDSAIEVAKPFARHN